MKKRLVRLLALLLTISLLLPAGCARTPDSGTSGESENIIAESGGSAGDSTAGSSAPDASSASSSGETAPFDDSEHRKFQAFTNELFLESVAADTVTLHYTLAHPEQYGITDYEITLGSPDSGSSEQNTREMQAALNTLVSFQYEKLPEDDRLTFDVLKDYLETGLEGTEFLYYEDLFAPISGLQGNLPIVMSEYTFRTERDITDYLALLEQIPAYLDAAADYERTRAGKGFVMPSGCIGDVIEACTDFVSAGSENMMISTFNERLDAFEGLDEDQKAAWKAQNEEAVTTLIFPAYRKLIRCLQEIRSAEAGSGGLCTLPRGTEYYSWLIRTLVGSGHTPEELILLTEDRVDTQVQELYLLLAGSPELAECVQDPPADERTPDEMLQFLKSAISGDYPALPTETSYEIKYVPESMEASSSPAFYMIPPIDDPGENTIYINNGGTGIGSLFSTLAHEGYPGHLYQTVYASCVLENPIRHILDYQGYTEGWALYVEHETYDLNELYTEQADGLARVWSLNSSISLGVYALLDLNIHYNGWTKDQAAEFIEQYFGPQDDRILSEMYDTIVSEPAYYLKYYVGYLEILLLREKAEARLEEDFDLKEFHKFLLDMGPCPFPVIDKYMESWMSGR